MLKTRHSVRDKRVLRTCVVEEHHALLFHVDVGHLAGPPPVVIWPQHLQPLVLQPGPARMDMDEVDRRSFILEMPALAGFVETTAIQGMQSWTEAWELLW